MPQTQTNTQPPTHIHPPIALHRVPLCLQNVLLAALDVVLSNLTLLIINNIQLPPLLDTDGPRLLINVLEGYFDIGGHSRPAQSSKADAVAQGATDALLLLLTGSCSEVCPAPGWAFSPCMPAPSFGIGLWTSDPPACRGD